MLPAPAALPSHQIVTTSRPDEPRSAGRAGSTPALRQRLGDLGGALRRQAQPAPGDVDQLVEAGVVPARRAGATLVTPAASPIAVRIRDQVRGRGPAGRRSPWNLSHRSFSAASGCRAGHLRTTQPPRARGQRGHERLARRRRCTDVVAGHDVGRAGLRRGVRPAARAPGAAEPAAAARLGQLLQHPGVGVDRGQRRGRAAAAAGRRRRRPTRRPARCPAGRARPRPAGTTARTGRRPPGRPGGRRPAAAAPTGSRPRPR